ncbi:hypothetical protein TVAG_267610 [Trichomonas vaginalis G3]|uniref:Importin N-terminal domain-containing protein n=1 Tax=Trichomonas vaginalis (strain ATCC PRA-98 / G3) TaxID=412133 RepID=A2DLB1_TRIV3|nr:armadillo (ARM) repeat-containing protein family [Trichomonas vaginalis G3]EAY18729.1 hypothetical protein TVAG_267610 [Trichomonas vaginalis G3]KAI5510163.1 armadillo (ARM) repeat-containing protein family [Trichomonas vaginalis G3]|eukprot:XP_001579715.1 hypothetical protein [Trichomonas vaginalis G3]
MNSFDFLHNLFNDIRSGDNNRIGQATGEILEFLKTKEEAIQILFMLLQTDKNDIYLKYASIFLHSEIRKYKSTFDSTFISELQNQFCQTIISIQNDHVVRMLCDDAALMAIDGTEFGPIPNLIQQLIQNANTISTSLYLISQIAINTSFDEELPFISELLSQICEFAVHSERNIRIEAMKLLSVLISRPYMDDIDETGIIGNIILNSLNLCLTYMNTDESLAVMELIKSVSMFSLTSIDEYENQYLEILINIMNNSEIIMEIRIYACLAYIEAIKASIDEIQDELPLLVDKIFDLAVEIYLYDPYGGFYRITDQLITMLSESDVLNSPQEEEEGSNSLSDYIFMKSHEFITDEQENDLRFARILVGLSAINFLISADTELIYQHEQEIIDFVVSGIQTGEEEIIENCAEIVITICNCIPDNCAEYIGVLTPLLLSNLQVNQVLNSLSSLFDSSSIPPPNIEEVLDMLIQSLSVLPKELQGDILFVIASALSKCSSSAGQYYERIKSVLHEAINEDSYLRSGAIRCFSIFASQSPAFLQGDLDSIIDLIIQILQEDEIDNRITSNNCICSIASNFPLSIAPKIEVIADSLISQLSYEYKPDENEETIAQMMDDNNSTEEMSKEDLRTMEIKNMKNSALSALSILSLYLPEQMIEIIDGVRQMFFDLFDTANNELLDLVCSCLVNIAEGFMKVNSDVLPICHFLIENLNGNSSADCEGSATILEAITNILTIGGRQLVEVLLNDIHAILFPILNLERSKWTKKGEVAPLLYQSCLACYETIIESLGSDCVEFASQYSELILQTAISNKNSNVYAAHAIIRLAEQINNSDLAQKVLDTPLKVLKKPNIEKKVISLQCLSISFRCFPSLFGISENFISQLVQMIMETLQSLQENGESNKLVEQMIETAFVLSIYVNSQLFSHQTLSEMVSKLVSMHEINCIQTLSSFALFCMQNGFNEVIENNLINISLLTFSSEDYDFRKVQNDAKVALKPIAEAAISNGNIEVLKGNEYKYQKLEANILSC